MNKKLICIIGPDGTGKSTQATLLIDAFREHGINYEYRWLRFFHFFSLPLLAFAHMVGLSDVITLKSGKKISYHYFYKSELLSDLYPILLFIDILLFMIVKLYLPYYLLNRNIVSDRITYDTLIDLMVSTGRDNIHRSTIGRFFLSLLPKDRFVVLLTTDEKFLRARREDVKYDNTLTNRIRLYNLLADELSIKKVDASLSICEIHKKIIDIITISE